jgi:hypothetical protein
VQELEEVEAVLETQHQKEQ